MIEKTGASSSLVRRYLATKQDLDGRFAAFDTETPGIHLKPDGSYGLPCLRRLSA